MKNILNRLDRLIELLETRPCSPDSSASPAAASAGSGGTAHADSAAPRTVSGADTGTDPTAAIRADPRRPRWLTDACLPLPVGTETVEAIPQGQDVLKAFPSNKIWAPYAPTWDDGFVGRWSGAEVYHVPQPAPADFTTPVPLPPGTVLNFTVDSQPAPKPTILPPAEMPEALRPYWMPESRVWASPSGKSFAVFPSGWWYDAANGIVNRYSPSDVDRIARQCREECTLLPNRTVTTESILGTASAAKAVEQGVADAVEGRTVEVSMPMTKHDALYDAARRYVESSRYEPDSKIQQDLAEAVRQLTPHRADQAKIPDPLDQLAAEAQAEGEYGTAWERWQSLRGAARDNGHKIRLFNAFVAAECERAVERAKASPRLSEQLDRLAQTEQFKNCQFDGVDPDSIVVIDGGKPSDYRLADEPKTIRGTGGPITPPTPRRTAREVAEEVVKRWLSYGATSPGTAQQLTASITAAIERDREGR